MSDSLTIEAVERLEAAKGRARAWEAIVSQTLSALPTFGANLAAYINVLDDVPIGALLVACREAARDPGLDRVPTPAGLMMYLRRLAHGADRLWPEAFAEVCAFAQWNRQGLAADLAKRPPIDEDGLAVLAALGGDDAFRDVPTDALRSQFRDAWTALRARRLQKEIDPAHLISALASAEGRSWARWTEELTP